MTLPGVGVFGTGTLVEVMVPFIRKAGFGVVGLWGKSLEEARKEAEQLDVPFSTDKIDDVLLSKEVDLVLVLCPPALHSQIAVKALGIGKHIVVPPPVAINQNETLRMLQAAQYYPSLISTAVYCLRALPTFQRLRNAILSEKLIGDVLLCDVRVTSPNLVSGDEPFSWSCDAHMGGGILNHFGSHVIDILHYVTGLKAVRVQGTARNFCRNTEKIKGIRHISSDDFVCFQMEALAQQQQQQGQGQSSEGCVFSVTINGCSNETSFNQDISICGTTGQLIISNFDIVHRKWQGGEVAEATLYRKPEELSNDDDDQRSDIATGCRGLPTIYRTGLALLLDLLARQFLGSREPGTAAGSDVFASFEDALYVQAVMESVRMSSRERKWVRVSVKQEPTSIGESLSWSV